MIQSDKILEVDHLYVSYDGVDIVRNVNFTLDKGKFLGIVGESGCGKTTLLRALMMLKRKNSVIKGKICFSEKDLTAMNEEKLRKLRGSEISMIPQNAAMAMDGTKTVSSLFNETMRMHSDKKISRKESDILAAELMKKLLLQDAERILKSYPFELSGGMCQRIMIAVSMINHPQLMLGDEPTSALDVTSQLQVIKELEMLKKDYGISLVMISHNLAVISRISDLIAIMYGGRIIEYGNHDDIIHHAVHPYTRALLDAVPDAKGNVSKGLEGLPPVFEKDMKGCPFAPRCEYCIEQCLGDLPEDVVVGTEHKVQCFRADEFLKSGK